MMQETASGFRTRQVASLFGLQLCRHLCKQASLVEPAVPPAPTGFSSATQQVRVLSAPQRAHALNVRLRCALGPLQARLWCHPCFVSCAMRSRVGEL